MGAGLASSHPTSNSHSQRHHVVAQIRQLHQQQHQQQLLADGLPAVNPTHPSVPPFPAGSLIPWSDYWHAKSAAQAAASAAAQATAAAAHLQGPDAHVASARAPTSSTNGQMSNAAAAELNRQRKELHKLTAGSPQSHAGPSGLLSRADSAAGGTMFGRDGAAAAAAVTIGKSADVGSEHRHQFRYPQFKPPRGVADVQAASYATAAGSPIVNIAPADSQPRVSLSHMAPDPFLAGPDMPQSRIAMSDRRQTSVAQVGPAAPQPAARVAVCVLGGAAADIVPVPGEPYSNFRWQSQGSAGHAEGQSAAMPPPAPHLCAVAASNPHQQQPEQALPLRSRGVVRFADMATAVDPADSAMTHQQQQPQRTSAPSSRSTLKRLASAAPAELEGLPQGSDDAPERKPMNRPFTRGQTNTQTHTSVVSSDRPETLPGVGQRRPYSWTSGPTAQPAADHMTVHPSRDEPLGYPFNLLEPSSDRLAKQRKLGLADEQVKKHRADDRAHDWPLSLMHGSAAEGTGRQEGQAGWLQSDGHQTNKQQADGQDQKGIGPQAHGQGHTGNGPTSAQEHKGSWRARRRARRQLQQGRGSPTQTANSNGPAGAIMTGSRLDPAANEVTSKADAGETMPCCSDSRLTIAPHTP